MKTLLIISGQTSTGKTAVGVQLAQKLNGEIVSFDSRQAYRYLDIVTGKDIDTLKVKSQKLKMTGKNVKVILYIKEGIPIWLYDLIDPKEYLSAYDFCNIAEVVVEDIIRRGKLPIIVGGSVFYIKVFLEGLGSEGVPPDWNARKELEKKTLEELQSQLSRINTNRLLNMNNSDKNNKRRLIRAIEVGLSQLASKTKKRTRYKTLFCALCLDKETLEKKIQERVMTRLSQGALKEVKNLLKKNYSFDDPGLQTIGYKQLRNYFEGSETLELSVKRWIQAEVQYAKRQMVFLKKMKPVIFMPADDTLLVEKVYTLVYSSL